ncbi:DUF3298 and DUF4163 domain-containing protein [Paenibacillus macquariensis]|uniref:DUF3298 domain-containing protein n=1 Tax=Paenibacillus macquariensis TaxID=948756 RepID=A0ABY1K4Q8_9BACL|nr:DUF3298 and DUF4163 domain-containing protein [Paenibacillus macquariensis]MEC0089058.1 DUF3298 domain-containing protein [Paenibacillus macquariensis]OAB31814.1 anti-sigma factor [Paenibacillus macquariensis subsp. macquariensis]SIR25278.1 protein of unknown function [Paenibacillus macquariensis]
MDNKLEQLQEQYRNVPIPDELDFVVHKALKAKKKRKVSSKWLAGVSAAAMVFIIGINSSATVANAFSVIPGVDSIVKVLTFREFAVNEPTYNADIKVPVITNLDNKELELGLNQKYLAENKKLFDEFQAEMETMKKEGDGHLGVDTGFEVKTDNDSILSIGRYVVNTVGSSSTTMKYDTIDKKNQILLNLPMLFKDDRYMTVIGENISNQMIAQMKADPDKVYWVATEENKDPLYDFKNIKKDQSFYINNSGQLVITFDKYDVAPGYMGLVEFVIPTEVISDILVSHNLIK